MLTSDYLDLSVHIRIVFCRRSVWPKEVKDALLEGSHRGLWHILLGMDISTGIRRGLRYGHGSTGYTGLLSPRYLRSYPEHVFVASD